VGQLGLTVDLVDGWLAKRCKVATDAAAAAAGFGATDVDTQVEPGARGAVGSAAAGPPDGASALVSHCSPAAGEPPGGMADAQLAGGGVTTAPPAAVQLPQTASGRAELAAQFEAEARALENAIRSEGPLTAMPEATGGGQKPPFNNQTVGAPDGCFWDGIHCGQSVGLSRIACSAQAGVGIVCLFVPPPGRGHACVPGAALASAQQGWPGLAACAPGTRRLNPKP
jgi:hypothetical protein